jgi:ABC-type nitrate/sulfonate/bicarbonate transport system substrate-binding protein
VLLQTPSELPATAANFAKWYCTINPRAAGGCAWDALAAAAGAWRKRGPATVQAIRNAVEKGIALLKSRPDEAATMLAAESGGRQTAADFTRLLSDPNTTFTNEVVGVPKLAEFMKSTGFLRSDAGSPADMMLKGW